MPRDSRELNFSDHGESMVVSAPRSLVFEVISAVTSPPYLAARVLLNILFICTSAVR